MRFHPDQPETWPSCRPLIIAHDVGRSRDRSTAVIGGNSPFQPRRLGIVELHELPQGLYGSARASALAAIDRQYHSNALIVADLSNDPTYAEALFDNFGRRVVGLHISRSGDGMHPERRPVRHSALLVYTVGRSYLLELLHSEMQAHQVRFVDDPMSRKAYAQLEALQMELRDSGTVYTTSPGQHDDLGMSCAMLAWAAGHPHWQAWVGCALPLRQSQTPRIDARTAWAETT